jgi:hypothetical protein
VRQALKIRRVLKKRKTDAVENSHKDEVRKRDRYCRFPLCGCDTFKLSRHVAHLRHKGMGGNPAGDRSGASHMILLCSARHKDNQVSVDQGTLRIVPLVRKKGTAGPCAFYIEATVLGSPGKWLEVGHETAPHIFEPFTVTQRGVLRTLADMQL